MFSFEKLIIVYSQVCYQPILTFSRNVFLIIKLCVWSKKVILWSGPIRFTMFICFKNMVTCFPGYKILIVSDYVKHSTVFSINIYKAKSFFQFEYSDLVYISNIYWKLQQTLMYSQLCTNIKCFYTFLVLQLLFFKYMLASNTLHLPLAFGHRSPARFKLTVFI